MSDVTTPFPPEGAAPPPPADPLAGDWSDGLRGPARALGIAEPKRLLLEGLPQPAPPPRPAIAEPSKAPPAEVVEAPAAWAATEDPLQSAPPSEPPSVIITFSEPPPAEAAPPPPQPVWRPEITQPQAFPPEPAPVPPPPAAFVPDTTPTVPAPAFQADAPSATPVASLQADVTPAVPVPAFVPPSPETDWSAPPPPAGPDAPTPWSVPVPAAPPPEASATAVAWEMPPPAPAAEPAKAEDDAWSAPPPVAPAADEWKAEAPPSDWQEVKKPETVVEAPPAADWGTLSSGPDWSAPPPAAAAPAAEEWGTPPPPPTSTWDIPAPAAAPAASEWDAPPPVAPVAAEWSAPPPAAGTDWSAPPPPPPSAPSWNAPPVGATALEQMDSEPPQVESSPEAAKDLFGAPGAFGEEEQPQEGLGPPEELASPEEFLKPVEDDDPNLLVPVDEEPPPPPKAALAALRPVGVGALFVDGEHRVAVHTRGGRTRRGSVKDIDLSKSQFPLLPQGGGEAEPVYHAEVKAVFFMLAPGEKPHNPEGGKVRVTFADGRTIEGHRDGPDAKHGFFLIPLDAAKTNTRRIYIARDACSEIKDG